MRCRPLLRLFLPSLVITPFWQRSFAHADDKPSPAIAPRAVQSVFDPARHMRVSEVKPHMTGYGLTVFQGTKIDRFDVEVVSVLKNFNPQYDVVLIRCKNDFLQHTGSIAGMSGSPIFLRDDSGRARMIGAFAYGWPLTKDPIAGVQPIEYMLALPPAPHSPDNTGSAEQGNHTGKSAPSNAGQLSWSLKDAGFLPTFSHEATRQKLQAISASVQAPSMLTGDGDTTPRLEPLATPLMASGLPTRVLEQLGPAFRAAGLVPLQSGTGGSAPADGVAAKLEPGSVLAVPLLSGNVELTAIGTTTEVIGDRVWGFGHPFNNEGRVTLPMGSGQVNGIVPNLQTSFKLGSLTRMRGMLTTDASVGVTGREGPLAPMVPIQLAILPADGSEQRVYHFNAALHPRFTPLIVAAAFSSALVGSSELPQYNTVDYDLSLTFKNGQTVRLANRTANATAMDVFSNAIAVMQAASDNPFERVLIQQISGSIKVIPEVHEAQILDIHLPKSKYHSGEAIKAFVTYQPFRAGERTMPVELDLPRDLGPGTYQLVISDAEQFFLEQQQNEPFRTSAQSIKDVFAVLKDFTAIHENALYMRLVRQPDGVAIGRTALPRLPSSRRQILMGAGRSDTTLYVSSTVKIVPTDLVMDGSATFTITVEAGAKVAVGGNTAARPPGQSPVAKPDDSRRPAGGKEPTLPRETPKPPDQPPAKPGAGDK